MNKTRDDVHSMSLYFNKESWQVCDWVMKWLLVIIIIMFGCVDLRRPRVARRFKRRSCIYTHGHKPASHVVAMNSCPAFDTDGQEPDKQQPLLPTPPWVWCPTNTAM